MKSYMTPLLLSLLLLVGCGDRGDTNARNLDDEKTPAATERAAEGADADTEGARGTMGTRGSRSTASRRSTPAARSNAAARADEASGAARSRVAWRDVTIPSGTALPLELETALSSDTATVEMPVRARLNQAIVVNGVTALPAGAIVSGEVTSAERAGRVKGRASLAFTFNQVRADNLSANIRTAPLSYVGEASKGEDATKIGAGAVGGAIVGGIVGGGDGAAKGAAIGGAAGTGVVLATRGKKVELPSGTDVAATLAAPVTIRVPAR